VNDLIKKASLSPGRRRLVELMQQLNFGRIEDLEIRAGEPLFNPAPRLVQDIKIGAENGPRPESVIPDFLLKNQVIELFEHFDRMGDATVACIDVKHGLPFKLVVEQAV
jgi:hypothetical protein